MGPDTLALLIPIFALSIPIVAIIAKAATKKYQANPALNNEQSRHIEALESRIRELEETVGRAGSDIERLEDKQNFISRLLEDKTDRS